MRLFGSERIARVMERMGMEEGEELQHPLLNKSISNAQKRIEQRNFGIRKHTLEFDNVMNKQRSVIYDFRSHLLQADSIREDVLQFLDDAAGNVVDNFIVSHIEEDSSPDNDIKEFLEAVFMNFPVRLTPEDIKPIIRNPEKLHAYLRDAVFEAYERKVQYEGDENMKKIEHYVFLTTIDKYWKDNLYAMDGLRESVSLRSYGQKDPLIEYKREAHTLFTDMMENLAGEVSKTIFALTTAPERTVQQVDMSHAKYSYDDISDAHTAAQSAGSMDMQMSDAAYSGAGGPQKARTVTRAQPKVGRNDPCPCGSGKKFKKCCGR